MKIQKIRLSVLCVLSASLAAVSIHNAQASQTREADSWLAPVLGAHTLQGDPGCEKVEVKIWPQGSWNAYHVLIAGQSYDIYFSDPSSGDLELSHLDLRYSHTSRGSWGKAISRIQIDLSKNEAGELSEVTIKDQIPGILWFWKNYATYNCRL